LFLVHWASHSFIEVSLAQVARNLSIGNSRELTARKTTRRKKKKKKKLVATMLLEQAILG
jgi:hypothetical protein